MVLPTYDMVSGTWVNFEPYYNLTNTGTETNTTENIIQKLLGIKNIPIAEETFTFNKDIYTPASNPLGYLSWIFVALAFGLIIYKVIK